MAIFGHSNGNFPEGQSQMSQKLIYLFIPQPYLLVSASVASAKKILVHGPDLSSIPSQLPIHEVSVPSDT